jgi:Trp operon repressor
VRDVLEVESGDRQLPRKEGGLIFELLLTSGRRREVSERIAIIKILIISIEVRNPEK